MRTLIWINGYYQNIKPEDKVRSLRNLLSFSISNNFGKRIVKDQGGYYLIQEDFTLKKVFRTLDVTYQDLYDILK
jgi:hypothetical protein